MPSTTDNLTKEYLLKLAPDISVFELYDQEKALNSYNRSSGNQVNNYFFEGMNRKYKRVLYRIEPDENCEISALNDTIFYQFTVNGLIYVIAICNTIDTIANVSITNYKTITGVGF